MLTVLAVLPSSKPASSADPRFGVKWSKVMEDARISEGGGKPSFFEGFSDLLGLQFRGVGSGSRDQGCRPLQFKGGDAVLRKGRKG